MKLKVEIADNPYTQAQGLMFRESLEDDAGMMFKFDRPQRLSFWGLNTYIPLDIAFVGLDGKISSIKEVKPMNMSSIQSDVSCNIAIEANAGYFEHHNIKPGDRIKVKGNEIIFEKMSKIAQLLNNVNKPKPWQMEDQVPVEINDVQGNLPEIGPEDLGQYLEDDIEGRQMQDQMDLMQDEQERMQQQDLEEQQQQPEGELPAPPQFPSQFQAVEWADQNNRVVRIKYTTSHGNSLVRDIEPHGQFYADSTQRMILVTFDQTIGDIRAFIIKNIEDYQITNEQFDDKFVFRAR